MKRRCFGFNLVLLFFGDFITKEVFVMKRIHVLGSNIEFRKFLYKRILLN